MAGFSLLLLLFHSRALPLNLVFSSAHPPFSAQHSLSGPCVCVSVRERRREEEGRGGRGWVVPCVRGREERKERKKGKEKEKGGLLVSTEKGEKKKRKERKKEEKRKREDEWDMCPCVSGWEKIVLSSHSQPNADTWQRDYILFKCPNLCKLH
jgi:hypothetical protein